MAETRLFTQRELILLTQTHDDIQIDVHEVKHKRERGWHLRILYQDKKNQELQYMTLVTARGNLRTFKNLDTVVDYIMEHCAHIRAFGVYLMEPSVKIGTRKSARTRPANETAPTKKTKTKRVEIKSKLLPLRRTNS